MAHSRAIGLVFLPIHELSFSHFLTISSGICGVLAGLFTVNIGVVLLANAAAATHDMGHHLNHFVGAVITFGARWFAIHLTRFSVLPPVSKHVIQRSANILLKQYCAAPFHRQYAR